MEGVNKIITLLQHMARVFTMRYPTNGLQHQSLLRACPIIQHTSFILEVKKWHQSVAGK